MSPRRQTISTDDILAGTGRVITRLGPTRFTLADVSAEVGLAPATLLQRFGSKHGLLLAFARQSATDVARQFAIVRSTKAPLDTLLEVLIGMTRDVATPEALSNHLAFLQMDLNDPEFHRYALDHARTMRTEVQAILAAAIEAGELAPGDTAPLAHAIQVTFNGSLITWAIEGEGAIADHLRKDLEFVLAPFRAAGPPGRPAPA